MISKQKSRQVTVGNSRFRHKVSTTPKSKGIYHLNLTAQSEDHNGAKLVVEGLIKKDIAVWPLIVGTGQIEFYPTVTRHEIEWFLREAINQGWDYRLPGPNFVLQASNEIFRPGFWATARAHNPVRQPVGQSPPEVSHLETNGFLEPPASAAGHQETSTRLGAGSANFIDSRADLRLTVGRHYETLDQDSFSHGYRRHCLRGIHDQKRQAVQPSVHVG